MDGKIANLFYCAISGKCAFLNQYNNDQKNIGFFKICSKISIKKSKIFSTDPLALTQTLKILYLPFLSLCLDSLGVEGCALLVLANSAV